MYHMATLIMASHAVSSAQFYTLKGRPVVKQRTPDFLLGLAESTGLSFPALLFIQLLFNIIAYVISNTANQHANDNGNK